MNKIYSVLLILFLSFLVVRPYLSRNMGSPNGNPCAKELTTFCATAGTDSERVQCLKPQLNSLSNACLDWETRRLEPAAPALNWNDCQELSQKYCAKVVVGGGRVVRCMAQKEIYDLLPVNCKSVIWTQMARISPPIIQPSLFPPNAPPGWSSCKGSADQFCSKVGSGLEKYIRCLAEKSIYDQLSTACKTYVWNAMPTLSPPIQRPPGKSPDAP